MSSAVHTPTDPNEPTDPNQPSDTGTAGAAARAEETVERIRAAAQERVDRARAEVERAKGTVEEVRTEVSAAADARRGGPVTSIEDAEAKAATLRAGIERDLAALRARVPDPEQVGDQLRSTAVTAGVAIAAVSGIGFILGRRRDARTRERDLTAQAEALAAVLARAEAVAPGADADGDSSSVWRWLLVLVGAGGAGVWWWQRQQAEVEDIWGPDPQ